MNKRISCAFAKPVRKDTFASPAHSLQSVTFSATLSTCQFHHIFMPRNIEEPETYESESQHHLWSVRLKATPGRVALLDLLHREKKPVSVSDMVKLLKKSGPALTSPSIYRALQSLVEAGLVERIDTSSDRGAYEIHVGRTHHHHITCAACGDVEDVRKCLPKNIESALLADSAKFDHISRHSLEFFGTCKKCARA